VSKSSYHKQWRTKNKDKIHGYEIARKKRNPTKFMGEARKRQLKFKYNLTQEDFSYLLGKQMCMCAACGIVMTTTPRKTNSCVVDHNHSTNKVRGLLCDACNRVLGIVHDSPDRLELLKEYLRKSE
jgi:hypothetical protein